MWNFRLIDVSDTNGGEPYVQLFEVYYNDKHEPVGYAEPCTGSETAEGIKKLIEWYALALDKPVLNKADFLKGAVA